MVAAHTSIQPLVANGHRSVALIAKPGGPNTGVGRYVHMLQHGLEANGQHTIRVAPLAPPLPAIGYTVLQRANIDLRTFLMNYPIWANYPVADVYHLTSQNLASLLLFRRPPGRVVVTVHDIIPYMLRHNKQLSTYRGAADQLFDRMAMRGLRRADHLIADSHYTKQCLIEHLGIVAERISVIYLGIDHECFRPQEVPLGIYDRYALSKNRRYLLYVGSEDPRKNLVTLLHALTKLRQHNAAIELIKVGKAHFTSERQRLCDLANKLGISAAIHFLDDVPEEDLALLYNLADICVMPSLYEGFGFPVLEAMACGTPVIAARAASLPELMGEAGLVFEPGNDAGKLLSALVQLLGDATLRQNVQVRGLQQVRKFSWASTTTQTCDVLLNALKVV